MDDSPREKAEAGTLRASVFALVSAVLVIAPLVLLFVNLLMLYPRFVYPFLFSIATVATFFWIVFAQAFLVAMKQIRGAQAAKTLRRKVFSAFALTAFATLIVATVLILILTPYFLT